MKKTPPSLSAKEIQALDQLAINVYKIPSIILMENSGRAVSDVVSVLLKGKKRPSVVIVCGTGNNGGDGLVAARHLLNTNCRLKVFLVGRLNDVKNDPAVHLKILRNLNVPILEIFENSKDWQKDFKQADLMVDAIFGVGLNREISNPQRYVIESINKSKRKVLSVDVPSGLDATTGECFGVCVKAHTTVTFTFPKKGFFVNLGPSYVGRLAVAEIGIPKKIWTKEER